MPDTSLQECWYVLFVRTGMEDSICAYLAQAGLDCFIPKKEVLYRKEGRTSVQIRPMFPGYLFITSALTQAQISARLREMRRQKSGILRELYYDDSGTSALTEQEQRTLEHLLNRDNILAASTGIIENDRVIIQSGPLKGCESRIVYIDRHKRTALLELDLCTRTVQVSVALEIVQKIHTV